MGDDLRSMFERAGENGILLGQDSGSVDGLITRNGKQSASDRFNENADTKRKRAHEKLVELIAQIQDQLQLLEQQIRSMEERFNARDGDAWREKLALKILDEDDIPSRLEGESIEDYRMRLEAVLIREMLNPDGSIKDKYKNHPELSDYAQWAQKKFHYGRANEMASELEDQHTTPDRKQEIIGAIMNTTAEEQTYAGLQSDVANASADRAQDKELNSGAADLTEDLLKPIG